MRGAGFGLIGLLLCAGIIFYMMWGGPGNAGQARVALEAKQQAEEVANKVSGRDDSGEAVTKAAVFEEAPKGLLVKSITPGSALEKKYGLKSGDVVLEAGPLELKGQSGPQEMIQLAYSRDDKLLVLRGMQKITLPDDRKVGTVPTADVQTAAPPAPGTPPGVPTAPDAPADNGKRTNPQSQARDLMKKIESH